MAETHAVEAREIRGALGRRHHVVGGYRQRQMRQAHFHRLRPEASVDLQRIVNQRGVAGLQPVEELAQEPDLEAREGLFQGGGIVRHRGVDAGRVLRIEPGHDGKDDGRILGGAGEDTCLVEAGREGDHAVTRHASVCRFDARHTGERRRLANRTAGIGAGGERCHARRGGGGRPAGRPAGDFAGIPGVLDGAIETGLIGGAHGELVHIGLGQHDGAGLLEPRHHGRVVGRDEVVQHARTAAGAHPVGAENVFMNEGDAE